jgi:hypothetical protein
MGTGIAEGKDRAKHAALHALSNPLLGQVEMLNYFPEISTLDFKNVGRFPWLMRMVSL